MDTHEVIEHIDEQNAHAIAGVDVSSLTYMQLMDLLRSATARGITLGAEMVSATLTTSLCLRLAELESRHPGEPRQH